MEQNTVIKVEKLGKKFTRSLKRGLAYGTIDTAKTFLGIKPNTEKIRKGEFWALKNINFELKRGETLGIIGSNGSGKSTLLRLLSGIFPPDRGKISVRGNIGSLISVGAGFHPQMTGRENIFLNGTILGMTKKELKEKFDDIVGFAEIGEFLDAPISHYSSGMRVRLGFAIAIHSRADILLIDEILSVGDLSFQNKSLRKLADLRETSAANIFVSHNLEHIRNVCTRVIVLDQGKIHFDGDPEEGIIKYQQMSQVHRYEGLQKENAEASLSPIFGQMDEENMNFIDTGILNSKGEVATSVDEDEAFSHFFDFEVFNEQTELILSAGIYNERRQQIVWIVSNDNNAFSFKNVKPGKYRAVVHYTHSHLMPGVYSYSHGIRNPQTYETFHKTSHTGSFIIKSLTSQERSVIKTEHNWELLPLS